MGAFRRLARMRCPRCGDADLDEATIHRCHRCDGTWLDEHTLLERMAAMQLPEPPRPLAWRTQKRAALRCAECAQRMEAAALLDVPLDRCRDHGVWFDRNELAQVLLRCHAPIPVKTEVPRAARVTFAASIVELIDLLFT